MKYLAIGAILLLLITGCINDEKRELVPLNKTVTCNKPYILVSGSCCLDINDNGICDIKEEVATTTTTTSTSTTTQPKETCFDGIWNHNETGVDCGGACKPCTTPCDNLIRDSVVKPAARTTKLCLSNNSYVPFRGLHLKVKGLGVDEITLTIKVNETYKDKSILNKSDLVIGNISIRLIGAVEINSTQYVQVYAWIIEGEITCSTNLDCGADELTGYSCVENNIVKQIRHYRCIHPQTVFSECRATERYETLKSCGRKKMCIHGDDECFPKECFDRIHNQDENSIDCGGACRPCHCFNKNQDADEEWIDCGGSCRPCIILKKDTTPPSINIASPINTVYTKQIINLNYDVNELTSWCGYSLNGRRNITVDGNDSIYARRGLNELILYCNDTSGNMNFTKQQFTVYLIQNRICPKDPVSVAYLDYFDTVIFYGEDENLLGVPDKCSMKTFRYSLSYMNDSGIHKNKFDATDLMRDSNFTIPKDPVITYDCRETGKLKINYVGTKRDLNPQVLSRIKTIIYFYESKPVGRTNAFFRIHPYNPEGNQVNTEEYLDIPYNPVESVCNGYVKPLYQEIDLTPLLEKTGSPTLDYRIGFYTSKINSEIRVMEMELYTEYKQDT
ncbi:MAG: hypothetical protein U9Q22_00650 [Candidatus Altiarchaeota archaeon]|nr:hypothetical protein [Candidatus Altiarchaeota archaeon]